MMKSADTFKPEHICRYLSSADFRRSAEANDPWVAVDKEKKLIRAKSPIKKRMKEFSFFLSS